MTQPIDSPEYDEMLLKFKNEEMSDEEAREFFEDDFEHAGGAVIAMRHIDHAHDSGAIDELVNDKER